LIQIKNTNIFHKKVVARIKAIKTNLRSGCLPAFLEININDDLN
jgi:hypothetical protein